MADDNDTILGDSHSEIASNLAISKNFFNFEGIGAIESDVAVIDEVQSFVDTCTFAITTTKKGLINDIFKQIFAFFALKCYDMNLTSGEMRTADYGLKMAGTYLDLIGNLPMVEDYQGHFYSKWPRGELPEEYKHWADEKFNHGKNGKDEGLDSWIANNADKYSGASKDIKLKVYFGDQVIKTAVCFLFFLMLVFIL